ncbi:MAG: hypothetical protein V4587_02030, partial [Acidobacteriota bacterium]
PIISVTISPRFDGDRERLQRALSVLAKDDPTIRIKAESVDSKTILSGIDDLHLEGICDRILHDFKIQVDVGEPKVIYQETIRKNAEAQGRYIRQTGGFGNYGHCKLRVEPNQAGRGYEFINDITGSIVPEKYIEPINQGVQEALEQGILAGHPLVDIKVTLFDGSYHELDSNERAFKFASSIALQEAVRKASPVLLEPVMSVEITVPEEDTRAVIGDIKSRRGRIESMGHVDESIVIKAFVPLAEMLGYGRDIHSISQGRACYSMRLARYEAVPQDGDPGVEDAGVTANKPKGPKAGIGFAAANLEEGSG